MKLFKRAITTRNSSGYLTIACTTPEDLWHLYNLVVPTSTDATTVRTSTDRKVIRTGTTGSVTSSRVRLDLSVAIEDAEFDGKGLTVRLRGRVAKENNYVRMNSYHTLDVGLDQRLTITKDRWDAVHLDVIESACNPDINADVVAILLSSVTGASGRGCANICSVTEHLTTVRATVEVTIPKRRTGRPDGVGKAVEKFYKGVYDAMMRTIFSQDTDGNKIKLILIASPGFTRDDFWEYLLAESARRGDREVMKAKSKFLRARSSSHHLHCLEEIFADAELAGRLNDTKYATEVNAIQKFLRMLDNDPLRAHFGYGAVRRAVDAGAVQTLMVTDALFRSFEAGERRKYVGLVEDVRAAGNGEVLVMSTMHGSGKMLVQVGGVAAILRFPMEEVEEDEMDDSEDEEVNGKDPGEDEIEHVQSQLEYDLEAMGL